VWILSRAEGRRPWLAAHGGRIDRGLIQEQDKQSKNAKPDRKNLRRIAITTSVVAVSILAAGVVLASSGDAIAEQTGLGASFIGFVLLAFSTSLPELSAALSAARRGLFTMAISDILGTNLINIGLLFVIDLLGRGDPVINQVGAFSTFGAILGVVLTVLFVIGLAERRNRTFLRMGYDSAFVIIAYIGGIWLLYTLRDAA
jgi:cation:H+ antiporter